MSISLLPFADNTKHEIPESPCVVLNHVEHVHCIVIALRSEEAIGLRVTKSVVKDTAEWPQPKHLVK